MIRKAKKLQAKGNTHEIFSHGTGWKVISGESGKTYFIARQNNGVFFCTCDWHKWHAMGECSHVMAIRRFLAKDDGKLVSAWGSMDDARRQHHTISTINDGIVFTSRSR